MLFGRRTLRSGLKFRQGLLAVGLFAGLLGSAGANPTGPTVRHGNVQYTPGADSQIQQLTQKAIVDWQSFSIGAGESVRFLQPDALSVILNRVTGANPSEILGNLSANGNVFLINPHGILFGPDSTVNVGGLVASTLNLTDESFLSGNYQFTQDGNLDLAGLVNRGRIEVTDAGYAVLVAPTLINEGTIVARAGNIVLASGEQATLNLDGRDLVHFSLQSNPSEGTVLLAPGMMSDAIAQTLGVASARRADSLVREADGSVRLTRGSGTLVQAGTVSADGADGVDGGAVLLDSADYTLVTSGSVTSASGVGENSSGGDVLVLSDMQGVSPGFTQVQSGAILAAEGGSTGDGGFIEVSGDGLQLDDPIIRLSAPRGTDGSFLLDPELVILVDVNDSDFMAASGTGGVRTNGSTTYVSDIFIEDFLLNTGSFTLEAEVGDDVGGIISRISAAGGPGNTGIDAGGASPGRNLVFVTRTTGGGAGGTGHINLGVDTFNITGQFRLQSAGDTDLGSSRIVAGDGLRIEADGNILGDGYFIDTRDTANNANTPAGGGAVELIAEGSIDLRNGTLYHDIFDSGGGVAGTVRMTTTNGDIRLTNSFIESETVSGAYNSDAIFTAGSGSDIILTDVSLGAKVIDLTTIGGNIIQNSAGSMTNTSRLEAAETFTSNSGTFTGVNIDAAGDVEITTTDQLEVAGQVKSGTRAELVSSGGNIVQSGTGVVEAPLVELEAAGSIGAINSDQMVNTPQVAVSAGTSAYIRSTQSTPLELTSGTGATQDFRIRSDNGNLTISAPVSANNVAFVTGTQLNVSDTPVASQTIPLNLNIHGNVNASNNLVLVSQGNINSLPGTSLTSQSLGLGATGQIGSAGQPLNFTTNNLVVVSPSSNLAPIGTPTTVPSVTSVGVTVSTTTNNQGPDPGPNPNPGPNPDPNPGPGPNPDPGPNPTNPVFPGFPGDIDGDGIDDGFQEGNEVFGSDTFAQNDPDLVEDELFLIREIDPIVDILVDPTEQPVGWWDDDEILKRKFRRKSESIHTDL